ncbi:uncharacterized protein LOC131953820 [Physella acuta]|uniref:uncharacterized protein LOC131953820 n=1 Tax=Physella acuta TaxID=109671 RepID=UPI0027DB81D0|nr:uncharacterized protein LOC131953820 [Physella acuta]
MKMEIKVDYPGMACEFHLSGGRNLRGGPAVFMPNPDSEFNIEKDTTDQNTVYFVGEPPENHPELAAKLRDGNRFNSCIEAPEDYEMAIQFKEAYLLERIVITTIDSPIPFSMMVTCYSLSEEEVVKQSVNYKDIRVFYLNINKKVKHCKIKSTKGPLKLCEVDVFGG